MHLFEARMKAHTFVVFLNSHSLPICDPQADPPLYGRAVYSTPMEHSAMSNMADNQSQMLHNKRNGRYDDDYPTYQEQKKPMIGYPTKSLTQRRPLSARSYSTETYGASQVHCLSLCLCFYFLTELFKKRQY